jgi:hypothetical protein
MTDAYGVAHSFEVEATGSIMGDKRERDVLLIHI